MKVLNLYSGIGGNRKLWTDHFPDLEITAVELNEEIATIYSEYFPQDKMVIGDAHEYLLKHYKEFDFIWSSPPCPKHSRTNYFTQAIRKNPCYPDMQLWQQIIFLDTFCKGAWVVENVIPFYEPFLPKYIQIGRHLIWSNFRIPVIEMPKNEIGTMMKKYVGTGKHAHDKKPEIRNMVNPDLGLYILEQARGIMRKENTQQIKMFE